MPPFMGSDDYNFDFRRKSDSFMFCFLTALIFLSLLVLFISFLSSIPILWLRISLIGLFVLGYIAIMSMIVIEIWKEPKINKDTENL